MHFIYFAQSKLEHFYDYLVDRTEETTMRGASKEGEGKAAVKGTAKIGKALALLGLGDLGVEAELSASGKIRFQREVVSKFTASQKLKALLLKLASEDRLVVLGDESGATNPPRIGASVLFTTELRTDYERLSERGIEVKRYAILSGELGEAPVEIQASLQHMESENAWRRWHKPTLMLGFGTRVSSARDECMAFDPIVLAYAERVLQLSDAI